MPQGLQALSSSSIWFDPGFMVEYLYYIPAIASVFCPALATVLTISLYTTLSSGFLYRLIRCSPLSTYAITRHGKFEVDTHVLITGETAYYYKH